MIFIVALLVGLWLEGALYRIRLLPSDAVPRPLVVVGLALVLAGALLALWGAITFRRHGTAVVPIRAATSLVQNGPYRFTRNPMYLGFTLAYLGTATALNAMWPLLLLPMALVLLFRLVIRKEERHLWDTFGDDYVQYRKRVRRWM